MSQVVSTAYSYRIIDEDAVDYIRRRFYSKEVCDNKLRFPSMRKTADMS